MSKSGVRDEMYEMYEMYEMSKVVSPLPINICVIEGYVTCS